MTVGNSFPSRVRHVQAGESVSAGVTSRATKALEARTNYLKEVTDAIEAGRALVQRNVQLAADVLVGQPVYWNADTQAYEQALAAVTHDATVGSLVPAASADPLGLVLDKRTGNIGDVVIYGLVKYASLANAVDGEVLAGRYYLSAVTPGKLVQQRPAVTVAVCVVLGPLDACDQDTWVLVLPQVRDFLEDHIHYRFDLYAQPAGCVTPPGDPEEIGDEASRHTIDDADADLPGWLPADHESFGGHAPTGARFGYNLAAHPALSRQWPPVPLTGVVLEEFRPEDGVKVGGRVPDSKVVFDAYGIWWMTDCYGEVPWPTQLTGCPGSSSSSSSVSSSESSEAAVCPIAQGMELTLSFTKMTFATDKTVVTSLEPATGQPIQFVNCDGVPAKVGELFAKLTLSLLIDDDEAYGGLVLKDITAANRFSQGYVTEGLIAGSDRVTLTSTRSRRRTPGDSGTPLVHQGLVTIDVNLDPTDRELLPVIAKLGNSVDRVHKGKPFIALPNGRDSSVVLQFNVPPAGLPTTPKFKIRVELFGKLAGTLTDLTVTYSRLARPADDAPVELTDTETDLEFASDLAVEVDKKIEVESAEFTIAAGDTVYVTIERSSDATPTYEAEIGLLRMVGIIVAGE